MDLNTDVVYLKGVGPQRAELLGKELGIKSLGDLLEYYPFRYVDRSHVGRIDTLSGEEGFVVLKGVISGMQEVVSGKGAKRLTALFRDRSGEMELTWFQGIKWTKENVKEGVECLVMGRVSVFNGVLQMAHPEVETAVDEGEYRQFIPVYGTTEKMKGRGLTSKTLGRLMRTLLETNSLTIGETLPLSLIEHYRLMPRGLALRAIHFPSTIQEMEQARLRLKFEELFFMQLDHQYGKVIRDRMSDGQILTKVGDRFNEFYNNHLPFSLTQAQKRVIREIWHDMRSGRQMNRLLQGDVGSGKTMVALMTILLAIDNERQACLMAPTEILAQQHYSSFMRMLDGMNVKVELLVGSTPAKEKRRIKKALKDYEVDILVGTHALLEDSVVFGRLGYVVIDEQHRFGVEQRGRLWGKSVPPPHVLVMTATPIPRTLAMTVYSDLDCSVIDELPPGRVPVKTVHRTDANRLTLFSFMRKQIAAGRQIYVVYPMINESEDLDIKDLMDGYESIARSFPLPDYQISIVHGRMPADAKAYEMQRFKDGITNIMVSTTVIEVGVDVPNATVMVIENAERFGLSQLHQLRGRVGRGADASYCILMTKTNLSTTGRKRIETMCETTDGFRIAEADLRLRGPGDIEGREQSGMLNLKLADIVEDEPIVSASRDAAKAVLSADPLLQNPENTSLKRHIDGQKGRLALSKIS